MKKINKTNLGKQIENFQNKEIFKLNKFQQEYIKCVLKYIKQNLQDQRLQGQILQEQSLQENEDIQKQLNLIQQMNMDYILSLKQKEYDIYIKYTILLIKKIIKQNDQDSQSILFYIENNYKSIEYCYERLKQITKKYKKYLDMPKQVLEDFSFLLEEQKELKITIKNIFTNLINLILDFNKKENSKESVFLDKFLKGDKEKNLKELQMKKNKKLEIITKQYLLLYKYKYNNIENENCEDYNKIQQNINYHNKKLKKITNTIVLIQQTNKNDYQQEFYQYEDNDYEYMQKCLEKQITQQKF